MKLILRLIGLKMSILRVDAAIINPKTVKPNLYPYNNDSNDNTEEILKKYIDAGYVDLIPFPGVAMQLLAYNDAIYRFKHKTRYMAIIDADEFLYSCNKSMSVRDEIADIFSSFPQAGGIAVNWRMFGSSGLLKKPIRGGC